MNDGFYRVVAALTRPLLHVVFPHKITGLENIPADGAVILCSNHVSLIDPVFLVCSVRRPIRFIAKKELFNNRFMARIFKKMGIFSVDRGGTDMAAMRSCLEILKQKSVLGIFPQGHRYYRDENRTLQSGTALIALKSRASVVPIHISGPVRPLRRTYIKIGSPLDMTDLPALDAKSVGTMTARLTEGIWETEVLN